MSPGPGAPKKPAAKRKQVYTIRLDGADRSAADALGTEGVRQAIRLAHAIQQSGAGVDIAAALDALNRATTNAD